MANSEPEYGGANSLWGGFRRGGMVERPLTLAADTVRDELIRWVAQQGAGLAGTVVEGDVTRARQLPVVARRSELMGFTLAHALIRGHTPSRREVRRLEAQWDVTMGLIEDEMSEGDIRRLDATLWLADVRELEADAHPVELARAEAARDNLPAAGIVAARCIAFPGHRLRLSASLRAAVDGVCGRQHPGISAALARGDGNRAETIAALRYFGYEVLAQRHAEGDGKLSVNEVDVLSIAALYAGDEPNLAVNFGAW